MAPRAPRSASAPWSTRPSRSRTPECAGDHSRLDVDAADWASTAPLVHGAPAVTTVNMHAGCTMSKVELDGSAAGRANEVNGCMPAACANSLQWLRGKYPQKLEFNGTPSDTFATKSSTSR